MHWDYTPGEIARFWSKVEKTDDCWLWTKGRFGAGYGSFGYRNRPAYAHHVAWALTSVPLPDGFHVLHTCDVRPCVRNDEEGWYEINGVARPRRGHLWIGTNADNMADRDRKGRLHPGWVPGEKNGHSKLTEVAVLAIRERYAAGGVTQSELATEYGVTKHCIQRVVSGKNWRHLLTS